MRKRLNAFLHRNTPPGLPLRWDITYILAFQIIAFLLVLIGFALRYDDARAGLFSRPDYVLIEGIMMVPFTELIDPSFTDMYLPLTVVMLLPITYHYAYYRQESMPIYLMKRLPNRFERHRRALTLPLLSALATPAIAIYLRALCFAIYLIFTPRVCLSPDVWSTFLEGMIC